MKDRYNREMYLSAVAERAAGIYVAAGGLVNCGHRDPWRQACAMAENVLVVKPGFPHGDRGWVGKVYKRGALIQQWLDTNEDATTFDDLSHGIYGVLIKMIQDLPPDQQLSHHMCLPCPVIDFQPEYSTQEDPTRASRFESLIRKLPGLTLFLPKEGGLIRWHGEFAQVPTVKVAVPSMTIPAATKGGSDDV